jgi:GTP-binding protein
MSRPVVAIVGRPNVGKSTFFNRCIGERAAIVDDTPGVTRDRIYQEADWGGRSFLLVDTGGFTPSSRDEIQSLVGKQAELAIEESDVIVFMVDGKSGLSGVDEEVANILRRTDKPVIVAVNKIDTPAEEPGALEFYKLGLGDPITLSAMRGTGGVGDLLDEVVARLPAGNDRQPEAIAAEEDIAAAPFSIAIVGRPNVGKSSLLNVLARAPRSIVAPTPGTTRDAVDTEIEFNGRKITLIDTAGIRRKSKVGYGVEAFAVVRSLRALNRADVVVLMLDAAEEIADQDQKIAAKIDEAGRAVVVVLNKWDLVEDRSSGSMNRFIEEIHQRLRHISYAEIVFTSALTRQRVPKILEAAERAFQATRKRVATSLLNQVINEATALTPPPASKRGKRLRVYYCTQASVAPPTFILFTNEPALLADNYRAYLERKIRESFGFQGSPIRIVARAKSKEK